MSLGVYGYLPRVEAGTLVAGEVFVEFRESGASRVCMVMETDTHRGIAVLGWLSGSPEEDGVHWMAAGEYTGDQVHPLPNAKIRLDPSAAGFAKPAERGGVGAVSVDSKGTTFLNAMGMVAPRVQINLETGKAGQPVGAWSSYHGWTLEYQPSWAPEPIVLFKHAEEPARR